MRFASTITFGKEIKKSFSLSEKKKKQKGNSLYNVRDENKFPDAKMAVRKKVNSQNAPKLVMHC